MALITKYQCKKQHKKQQQKEQTNKQNKKKSYAMKKLAYVNLFLLISLYLSPIS